MSDPDWHACAALVERGDPNRFRAAMAAPSNARAVLFPIYAMALEVSRAPWVTQEPMIAEMRLQWWRDVLEEIKTGQAVRSHEVTTPLARVLTERGCDALDAMIEARRWDIYKDPFEDEAAFTQYLEATTGGVIEASAGALGRSDPQACRDAGFAGGLARYLQAIPSLEAQNRIPLLDGRPEAIAALAKEGIARLTTARKSRTKIAGTAMLSLWETQALLTQVAQNPHRVAEGTLDVPALRSAATLSYQALTGRW